jgi:phthalate 4,5-dioxygenase
MPWYGVIAPRELPYEGGATFFAVPIDDENSTYWTVRYRVDQPIEKDAVTSFSDPADWPPAVPGDAGNNWGQDRELMRRGHFTRFPQHLTTEDLAIVTSQGPIVDRTKKFLNSGDGALVRLRRLLL